MNNEKIFIDEDKAQQAVNLHICILIFITLPIFAIYILTTIQTNVILRFFWLFSFFSILFL